MSKCPRCCEDGTCPDCQNGVEPAGESLPVPVPYEEPVPMAASPRRGATASIRDLQPSARRGNPAPATAEPALIGPVGYDQRN